MKLERRDFLEGLIATGALPALLGSPAVAKAAAAVSAQDVQEEGPGNACAFWSQYYAAHTSSSEHAVFCRATRGGDNGVDDDRQINFLHYQSADHQLRFAHVIPASELLPYPGDVKVSLNVGGIRLSKDDQQKFENLQSAQLRLDLAQNRNMLAIADKLAWASIAALFPKQGKLPPLQDLTFNSASTSDVFLPGGSGVMGVNVSMTRRQSWFYQHLQEVTQAAGRFAPILGLPAISLSALNGFYLFYGYLENRTKFLFQTAAPQPAFATQPAREEAGTSFGINLLNGDYVLVPQEHINAIQPHLSDYKLVQGYLIPQDADPNQSVYALADKITPDISYLTLNVKVTPMIQGTASAGSQGSSSSTDGSAGGAAKSGTKPASTEKPPAESKKPPV
jgi:hypothetical protein